MHGSSFLILIQKRHSEILLILVRPFQKHGKTYVKYCTNLESWSVLPLWVDTKLPIYLVMLVSLLKRERDLWSRHAQKLQPPQIDAHNRPTRTHYADGEVPEGLTSRRHRFSRCIRILTDDAFGDEVGEEFLVMPFQYRSENEPIDTLVTMIENNRLSIGENSDENAEYFTLDGDSAPGDVRRSGYQEEKTDQQLALHDSMTRALNEAVKQRYSQLMVGVDLANRYEAALLSALECLDESHSMHRNLILPAPLDIGVEDKISDTQNALNRLLSNDTRWYDRVELDVDFVRDEAHYLERHTKSSITYVKPSLNGLEPVRHIKLHPSALPGPNHYAHEDLFEDILDLKLDDGSDKGHQTYNEMQRDFYNSFRFHSAQKHVAASTSILDKGSTVKTAPHSKLRRLADKNRKKSKTSIGLSQVRQGRVVDESGRISYALVIGQGPTRASRNSLNR